MFKSNQMSVFHKTSIAMILLAALVAASSMLVTCEQDAADGSASSVVEQGSRAAEFTPPKRQYLIAPRIGRSGEALTWATAFGEGPSLALPQLQQQQHLAMQPNRASLLFLIGNNRRFIGPRSTGLMPQARIGRRSAPSGWLPQPRVGRRSDLIAAEDFESGNQQEVAMATLSDSSSVDEAINAFLSATSVVATNRASGAEAALDRPVQRATAFVPRLGKREGTTTSESRLCALFGLDCARVGPQQAGNPPMAALTRAAYQQGLIDQSEQLYEVVQLLSELRASPVVQTEAGELVPFEDGAPLGKRVVFTPRIGR